jgi:hypothetical protein
MLSDTSTTAIIDFLRLISQPLTTKIEITFHGTDSLEFIHPFFVKLRASQHIRDYGPAQELQIEGPHYFETVARFKFHSPAGLDRHLVLRFERPVLTTGQILTGLEEEVDYSSISRLETESEELPEETWTSMFSSLTTLREIYLDVYIDEFSAALSIANHGWLSSTRHLDTLRCELRDEETFALSGFHPGVKRQTGINTRYHLAHGKRTQLHGNAVTGTTRTNPKSDDSMGWIL